MVNTGAGPENWELYDLQSDPGEAKNVAAQHPGVVRDFSAAYDRWWAGILASLVNEEAKPPAVAPYKELYRKQFGGSA
jgi:arylsulfatase